jgi:hypothetical protein
MVNHSSARGSRPETPIRTCLQAQGSIDKLRAGSACCHALQTLKPSCNRAPQ